eukprot:TRINITY_DN20561_c0_g1_i1.p2 TRINITY_DN20561_c0_g1~~TRINITY_DN20561_c0_g1_i1.p2  ORF type:complete len:334 (-),score=38.95 TRINITY_DN20561_c0_g1_i1:178-1152(-)
MHAVQLRYPTALDLPPSEVAGADLGAWTSEPVSIDRRLFRRLRRPGSAGPTKKQHEAAFTFGPDPRMRSDEDWYSTSYGEEETDGAAAAVFPGSRRRLAGSGLEEEMMGQGGYDSFDEEDGGYEGELEIHHPAHAREQAWVQPAISRSPKRSHSSPQLRRRGGGAPVQQRGQHVHHYHHHHHLHHQHYDAGYEQYGTPPRAKANCRNCGNTGADFMGDPCDCPHGERVYGREGWVTLTPEPRRRPSKSDPVSRGAALRGHWARDPFLRNSGTRKFDLRGCGKPIGGQASPQRCAPLIPSYIPPHEKRRDDIRFQMRVQMREPDF